VQMRSAGPPAQRLCACGVWPGAAGTCDGQRHGRGRGFRLADIPHSARSSWAEHDRSANR